MQNVKNIMARARSASPVSTDKLRKKAQSVHKPVYQDVFQESTPLQTVEKHKVFMRSQQMQN